MPLEYEIEQNQQGITVLRFKGKIVLGREAQSVEALAHQLIRQERKKLVFDLSGVEFIDSTGVGSLAMCCALLQKAQGEIRVAGASGRVLYVLQLTHMDEVLKLYSSTTAACENFGA